MLDALIPTLRPQSGLPGRFVDSSGTLLDPDRPPSTPTALDVVDFVAHRIAAPIRRHHDYFDHHHLTFNTEKGRSQFQDDVEEIFARNGVAFAVGDDFVVKRLGPPEARPLLSDFTPQTGDSRLDELLRTALTRFTARVESDREEALQKLWDAFERLKTLELGGRKPASIAELIRRTAPTGRLGGHLDREAKALTDIGNQFHIRHSEHDQEELPGPAAVDYLFVRLLALIGFLLRQTGRMQSN
jgi:hypothetical protein